MEALGLPDAMCFQANVRNCGAIAQAVRETEAEYGPTDSLFNNAGIARPHDIATQAPAEQDESIDSNTKGVINALHPIMEGMKERRHDTIVMLSSIAGRKVYPDHTVYCGTKFFVHAVSESIHGYIAPHNLRVISDLARHY